MISLKSDMEEEIPFPLDSTFSKIEDIWFGINLKSKKKIIVNIIEPLKKNILQLPPESNS